MLSSTSAIFLLLALPLAAGFSVSSLGSGARRRASTLVGLVGSEDPICKLPGDPSLIVHTSAKPRPAGQNCLLDGCVQGRRVVPVEARVVRRCVHCRRRHCVLWWHDQPSLACTQSGPSTRPTMPRSQRRSPRCSHLTAYPMTAYTLTSSTCRARIAAGRVARSLVELQEEPWGIASHAAGPQVSLPWPELAPAPRPIGLPLSDPHGLRATIGRS